MSNGLSPSKAPVRVTTGDRVRGALAVAKVPQRRAAAELGISQSQLSRRIAGEIDFRTGELERLAALCDVEVSSLIPPVGAGAAA